MLAQVARFLAGIQKYVDKIWYLPLVAFLVAADLFILVIPSDGLLVSSVLMRPKKWLRTAVWLTTGSSVGALVLAGLIQWDSVLITEELFPTIFDHEKWGRTEEFIRDYGAWALAIFSFGILPQQPAVAIAALAKMPLPTIFLAIWVGRILKYGPLAAAAAYAPRYLSRIWFVRKEIEAMKKAFQSEDPPPRAEKA